MGNAEVLRAAVTALQDGDIEALGGMLADDIVVNVPGTNKLSGEHKGKDEFFGRLIGTIMELTGGEFRLESHDLLGSEEHAVGLYQISASRNGKPFTWRHVNVYHFENEKVATVWQFPGDFEAWNRFWS